MVERKRRRLEVLMDRDRRGTLRRRTPLPSHRNLWLGRGAAADDAAARGCPGRILPAGARSHRRAGRQSRPHRRQGSVRRITIYVFDSMAKVNAWQKAPEQKELAAIRDKSSSFRSYVVEGCAGCKPPAQ